MANFAMNEHGGANSLALFGGALDTGNLGVAALSSALIEGAARCLPDTRVTVFDNSWGQRTGHIVAGEATLPYNASGARISRRYHQPETMQTMAVMARLGGLGNPGVAIVKNATAVLDVSGGDSFTDMYGEKTFRAITFPKLLAHRLKTPLILLPQTYGPFYSDSARRVATKLTRGAQAAWARDASGFEVLQELMGSEFDAQRHRQGVDMAFGLTPTEPSDADASEVRSWLATGKGPIAGINISGLLVGAKPENMTYDTLAIDYEQAMSDLIRRFLADSDARLLMVPHVNGSGIAEESDNAAVSKLLTALDVDPSRVRTAPADGLTANEAKWWISQCDWFCGTRMHSTIAALSSGVPTAAVAYSLKTKPVFGTVGQQEHVVDARDSTTADAVDHLWSSWLNRDLARPSLAQHLPPVLDKVTEQMDSIMSLCADLATESS